ncbi:RNA polymerase subunit sigma-70 [Nocardia puris]|uniref:RNA polymerase subunit sigma-70 n=1 Tax=Nocardia puris TaxID=208602 RepID=UPI002B4B1F1A|nr:RNA polymerase subunit sigma-70 [Nocardia puris]
MIVPIHPEPLIITAWRGHCYSRSRLMQNPRMGDGWDNEAGFETIVERHRRELHVHCYRMLGSFDEAEDLIQETFLRAWSKRDTFNRGDNARAWLYRIATNACLDVLRRRRRVSAMESFAEVPWLQPYPDHLLDQVSPSERQPEEIVVARETIELAFIAALQLLPAQQRAALVLREVIGWSAAETAQALDTSVPAVNSALQRARRTMQSRRSTDSDGRRTELSAEENELLRRYVDLHENPQPTAMAALVRDDIRITMPPQPVCFIGWDSLAPLHELAFGPEGLGDWKVRPTVVNRMPAAACYRRATGDNSYRAFKLDVLRFQGGLIAEITTFERPVFDWLGLPIEL